jgi:FkbM family methyltransferase
MAVLADDALGKIAPQNQRDGRFGEADGMKISVVIPCYNAAKFLPDAVESVLKQQIDRTEILIVDDASTDETLAVAHRLAREQPNIRVLRQAENGGPAKARNVGLREATGQYVCFLDADDAYGDHVFAKALAMLDSAPWVQAVDFPITLIDCHREVHPLHVAMLANSLPSSLIARREIARSLGGFPEGSAFRTRYACEDIAFRNALREWGNIHRLEGISLKYRVRPGSHFDAFLDRTRIENGKMAVVNDEDSRIASAGMSEHLVEVRSAMRRDAGVGATQSIEWNRGKQCRRVEVFQNPASLKHALETLTGKTYPRIPFLTKVNTVVDIGANIGASALFFASQYPQARIVAAEPARRPFVLLRCNTLAHAKVAVYNVGLLDRTIKQVIHHGLPDTVTNSITRNALSGNSSEEIQLVAADMFIKQVGMDSPDIIKIDTEGCEVPILRSILDSARRAKAIYLEYHSEEDRLQIDRMFADTHILSSGKILYPHRGELVYVRNDAFPSARDRDHWRIGSAR